MKTNEHQFLNPLAPSSMYPLEEGKFKGFKIHLSWGERDKSTEMPPGWKGSWKDRMKFHPGPINDWHTVKFSEKDIDEFIYGSKASGMKGGWKEWYQSDNLPKWLIFAIMAQMNKKNVTPPVVKAYETVMQRIKDGKIKEIKITPPKYAPSDPEVHKAKFYDTYQRLDPKYWK